MTLAPGATLASYQILGPLGAGAMGEVYRAKDTRLDREVAIKVLPEHFAEDEERLRRFEREARTLASLNHPNVAQIFGVDQVGDTCFLVLELVPGESLEERLQRGPLPLGEALDVCRQIAAGLEAAHEAGVIHRDLKPANVRITPDGKVKVLDFGLAKPAKNAGDTSSSTDSVLSTEAGRLLGTPTYMAPEQARGKSIDTRVDVWAIGCVLYECLTGRRAFAGETLTDVLGAVLHTEPDPARLPAATPPRLRELLADCLAKDPRARVRDAGEVRRQLERVHAAPVATEPKRRMSTSGTVGIAVFAAVASSVAGAFASNLVRTKVRAAAPPPTRFTVALPDQVKKPGDGIACLAFSADGRSLVVSATAERSGLWVRDLGQLEARLLPGADSPGSACFSPDGRSIAYVDRGHAQVMRVRLDGGMPQTIGPQISDAGMDWSPEGYLATGPHWGQGLAAMSVADASVTPLTTIDTQRGDGAHMAPCFLPGGRAMLYQVWTGAEWDAARIDLVDLETHEQRTVQKGATSPKCIAFSEREGALLYVRAESLCARRFDLRTKECNGDEVLLVEGLQVDATSGQAVMAVSPSGTLAYQAKVEGLGHSQLWWVTRDGKEEPATSEKMDHQCLVLSADGNALAFAGAGAVYHVYTVDLRVPLAERSPHRITFEGDSPVCLISRDGARIAYDSNRDGAYRVYVQDLAGAAPSRAIFEGDAMPRSWTPDGRWIALNTHDGSRGVIRIASADGSDESRPFVQVKGNAYDPQFSPDGRWLAYAADESGSPEVYVVAFPAGERRIQVTSAGGSCPRWSTDGTEIYYRKDGEYFAVQVTREPELAFGMPRSMFRGEYAADWSNVGFLPAPDGRFLMNKPLLPADRSMRIVVVEHFVDEVQAKLATASLR
ncbi:MAG TPA: protein kinase [Planctomycetota bacterium]|jgi:tRNA A-37 threonylcarbamoyl transferase component Bud32|nr:protein kinase [Planctomycetota bacterium]